MTAQTAGDLIDITLDDDYDAQMKFNVFWVRGGAEQPWISPPTNLCSSQWRTDCGKNTGERQAEGHHGHQRHWEGGIDPLERPTTCQS